MPDLTLETLHAAQLNIEAIDICGVDEAGRGPWAGPVTAGAVILDQANLPVGLNDSKKLSEAARERLFEEIKTMALAWSVASASPEEIDAMNILAATHLAMKRAVDGLKARPRLALVDGNRAPKLKIETICIVKGDSLSSSIAAASILAKVTRDHLMLKAETDFPGYGFASHKGYGVPAHSSALRALGPCSLHRRSFKPVRDWALRPTEPSRG